LYELGSSALSFGSAGSFTAPILEGTKSINDLLRDELRYPTSSRESGAHGVVRIKGILTERGELTDLAISKSVDRDLDAEVFRIVRKLRFKSPGLVDGKPARLCITMPVTFAVE
jgi:TonB family protein